MKDTKKKEIIDSLRQEAENDTFSFEDLMSRKEKRQKKQQKKFEEKVMKDFAKQKEKKLKKELEQTQKIEKQKIKEALKEDKKIQNEPAHKPVLEKPDVKLITPNPQTNQTVVKKKITKPVKFILSLTSIGLLIFWIFNILDSFDRVNQVYNIICSSLICLGCLLLVLAGLMTKTRPRSVFNTIGCTCLLSFAIINSLVLTNVLTFPTQAVLEDFSNKSINVAMKWAQENKVNLTPVYEYSDSIKENYIITQNKKGEILAKNIDELKVIVSQGPNYDLEANLPDMIGWDVDRVVKKIKDLKFDLESVNIDFAFNEAKRDTLYEQSKSGKMKRNENLDLKFSLGNEEDLKPVKLIELKNKTKFDATLWLKRNGIQYKLEYKFDDNIDKGKVISTDPKEGTIIDQKEMTVTVYISKGSKIVAPDFTKMTLDEIIDWASKNNISLNYESEYNRNVKAGDVIRVSVSKGTIIEEGTTITVVTSKGSLKMIDFKDDINKLRSFAESHGIKLVENQEFSDSVEQGKIIRVSHKSGQVINTGESIEVVISKGKVIKVPNFIGMTESEARNTCNSSSLDCTFSSVYSSKTKGTVVDQNKTVGSEVSKDTNIVISISAGEAPSYSGGSNSSSTGGGNSYHGGGTVAPSCDRSRGADLNIQAGSTGIQTQAMILQMNSHKFDWNFVSACPNGDTTPGAVCTTGLDGVWKNYCDTIPITVVR